ncbi:hypothetical protein [Actinomadura soli]|uniref:hypothetical protein n=1 Tax=Actinomadura soli TaxID=2508997 RepID=UPI001E393600|nr:hypothetical protein [Actinomadura soli]
MVELIGRPRPQVVVPAKLARQVKLGALLPDRVRQAIARRYGLDRIFLDFDPDARKSYDARIRT